MSLPVLAMLPIKPGCGKSTMSGGLPASTRVEMVASNCFELSYWIVIPVAASKAFALSLNFTSSAPANAPNAETLVPLYFPAMASANSLGRFPVCGAEVAAAVAAVVGASVAAGALVGAVVGCEAV